MNDLLEIYDLSYNKLCYLTDNTQYTARNIQEDFKINAINTLSFDLPINSNKWIYILNENLVKWKGEYYFIKVPEFAHSIDKKIITIQCQHMCSALQSQINVNVDEIGKTATALMTTVLQNSGWTVGLVNAEETKYRSLQTTEQSVLSNLVKIAELFDGILTFNSVYKSIDLNCNITDRHIQIRKCKNLKSVNIQYDSTEMVTRLFPFGGVNPDITQYTPNEINIMSVNPTGKSYIENYSYFLNQGYTQEYIDACPELFLREMVWRDNTYLNSQDLYTDALKKMNIISQPKVKATIEGLDLNNFPQHFVQTPVLGENVYIIDEDLDLTLKAQVIAIRKSSNSPLSMQIDISNEVLYNSAFKQLIDSSKVTQQTTDGLHEIIGFYIKDATIDNAKITNLNADKINAGIVKAEVLDAIQIKTSLLNSQIITADSGILANESVGSSQIVKSSIGDAQISSLSAVKLNSGTIDTSKVTIQGSNGRLSIVGNKLQVLANKEDNSLFERISLGDVNNDETVYGLRIRGSDGTTILMDETGVKKEGITNGIIDNSKISDNANINGSKLDIASVVTQINNGVSSIQSSKVSLNNSTLDVEFSNMEIAQTAQGDVISNHSSQITSLNNAIILKVSTQDFTTYTNTNNENILTINNQLSTQGSGISVLQGQIVSKVEQLDLNITNSNVSGLATRITTAESNITQNANNISLKVNTTDFNSYKTSNDSSVSSLNTRMNSAELKITDSIIVSTVRNSTSYISDLLTKANQTDLNTTNSNITTVQNTANTANSTANTLRDTTIPALTTRVNTAESNITQNANNIALKVAQTTYDTYVSSNNTAVANAQNTANSKKRIFTSTPITPYDIGDLWISTSTSGSNKVCTNAKASGSYIESDWVDDSITQRISNAEIKITEENIISTVTNSSEYTQQTKVPNYTPLILSRSSLAINPLMGYNPTSLDTIDNNTLVIYGQSSNLVYMSDLNINNNGIVTFNTPSTRIIDAESSIAQNSEQIALKVNANGVISAINLSPEEVAINANRIQISGSVTLLNLLDSNDNTKINGGNIATNSITATQINSTNLHVSSANVDGTFIASKINGGTLTLGGSGNVNGSFSLQNSSGIETIKMDNTGLLVNNGSITIKDTNGTSIITGSGVNATTINQGVFDASKLAIQNLVVGTNVSMGAGATISWSQVTSQPAIPTTASQINALDSSYSNRLTKIGSDGIYTGVINAGQITAGAINASLITTGTLNASRIGGTVVNFDNGCSVDTSSGDMRLRKSSSAYVRVDTDGFSVYSGGSIIFTATNGTFSWRPDGVNEKFGVRYDGVYFNNSLLQTGGGTAVFG